MITVVGSLKDKLNSLDMDQLAIEFFQVGVPTFKEISNPSEALDGIQHSLKHQSLNPMCYQLKIYKKE